MLADVTAPDHQCGLQSEAGTTANKASIITASAVGLTLTISNYNRRIAAAFRRPFQLHLNLGTDGTGILNGIISGRQDWGEWEPRCQAT
jgi:hypothetical protein